MTITDFTFYHRQADTTADRKDREEFEKLKSLARRLGYRVVLSLANSKYAGTAALIRCVFRKIECNSAGAPLCT